jgi:hypothetical protein
VILGQPLHQRRWHQQQLAALTRNEISSHTAADRFQSEQKNAIQLELLI